MKITRLLLLTFLVGQATACEQEVSQSPANIFQPQLMAIVVENLEQSLDWYTQVLEGTLEKPVDSFPDYGLRIAFLQVGDFHLELIESTAAIQPADLLPNTDAYLGGWFKVGFMLSDIKAKYDQLKTIEALDFVTGIGELPATNLSISWPTQFFLLKDPDGNYVQFFDGGVGEEPTPWLFMNTVKDLPKAISWYTQHLGFTHHETLGDPGNRRAILAHDNFVLELFEPATVVTHAIPGDSMAIGFTKLAFGLNTFDTLTTNLQRENIPIVYGPEVSDSPWASQYIIVKDMEANWVQLFDIK